eukprot:TRINITY_DN9028_c0_g1_i1.p1 TRINITY_DN9028_c0_g1~~TRINITY_DN9028_c0_g1_i1.p1  ORF type:complete len:836 (+),score=201.80 TRINITY_DN9028_c0_g1_i1:41-2548(+)
MDQSPGPAGGSGFLETGKDVDTYIGQLFEQLVLSTKLANKFPNEEEFPFQRVYAEFNDQMNEYSGSLLHTLQQLVNLEQPTGATNSPSSITEKMDESERYDRLIEVLDNMFEKADTCIDEASGFSQTKKIAIAKDLAPLKIRDRTVVLTAANIVRPQLKFEPIDNLDRPPVYQAHPYEAQIRTLECPLYLLHPVEPVRPESLENSQCTWIDSLETLHTLVAVLESSTEIAVDLEAHSYRSFQGFTCLMQISTRTQDYLVDCIELRPHIKLLANVFANPRILKVLHGADMDVVWLQRDFGIYMVNMFDTGQAARMLNYSSFGLAHLLFKFCQVEANKKYQLADWRIRPLPVEMLKYAREDTHYLLYIFDCVRKELLSSVGGVSAVVAVYDRSRSLCYKLYEKERFDPFGWRAVYEKTTRALNDTQLRVLARLYQWRDEQARQHDESVRYVMPNQMMLAMAERMPTNQDAVMACCTPVPPLVRIFAQEIAQDITGIVRGNALEQQQPLQQLHPQRMTHLEQSLATPYGYHHADPSASPVLSRDQLFLQADWREATAPRHARLSTSNPDNDVSQPQPASMYKWESDDEDSKCLDDRERAEEIRKSLSLNSFIMPTDALDEITGKPEAADHATPTQESFPKRIEDVYVLSNYTRKRNKEKKQLRSETNADDEDGEDEAEAKRPRSGSVSLPQPAVTDEHVRESVAFMRTVGWVGEGVSPTPDPSVYTIGESGATAPSMADYSNAGPLYQSTGSTHSTTSGGTAGGIPGERKHRRRKSKNSQTMGQAGIPSTFDYSAQSNPFAKPSAAPQSMHFTNQPAAPTGPVMRSQPKTSSQMRKKY